MMTTHPLPKITLLLVATVFLVSSFTAPAKSNLTSGASDTLLCIDSCTFSIGDQSASLGDEIQQWTHLLGPYSRCERKRTGNMMMERLDSVFVWDNLGITLLAAEEENWRIGEAIVFMMNKQTKGIDTSKLHYCSKTANFREMYAQTPNYIENWSQSFGRGDEQAIQENRIYLTEMNDGNLSLPTLYPKQTFSEDFILAGSLVRPGWKIKQINTIRTKNALPLLGFIMHISTHEPKNLKKYMEEKQWKSDRNHLNTRKTLEGIYALSDNQKAGPVARTTNGRVEFFVIRGVKECGEE
jgi:hypothetical protein